MKYVSGNFNFRNDILNIYPYISHDLEIDTCIIGGSIAGLITAYFLAKENKKVIIVEKNIIGFGNSTCDTGILDLDITKIAKIKKEDEVNKIITLYNDAKKDFITIAEEIGYNNITEMKKIVFTNKIMQKSNLQKYINVQNDYNIKCNLKENDENIHSNLNVEFREKVLVIDTYEFTQKLAIYLTQKLNVDIYENTEIVSVNDSYEEVELLTNNEFYINAKKVIYCTGIDFLNEVDIDSAEVYQKSAVITKRNEGIQEKKKVYYNFNIEDMEVVINEDTTVKIADNSVKVNPKLQDEKYKDYIEKDKYTKLTIYLNKLLNNQEYAEADQCYSYLFLRTLDSLPFIDELECKNNCFCNISSEQNVVLSGIIGGKMLKNMVKGLFTKEMKFFKITRGNCN